MIKILRDASTGVAVVTRAFFRRGRLMNEEIPFLPIVVGGISPSFILAMKLSDGDTSYVRCSMYLIGRRARSPRRWK